MTSRRNELDYEYRATGVLGDKRETMLKNELHARPEIARPLIRGHTFSHAEPFGKHAVLQDGGVPEAIRGAGWSGPSSTFIFNQPKAAYKRDFLRLNKSAVQEGFVTAKEYANYRVMHDIKRKIVPQGRGQDIFKPRRIPPNMTYGMPTRPPTPLWDLIEHRYQDKWIEERRKYELARRKEKTKKLLPLKPNETRTSQLRMYQIPVDPAPLWKLKCFEKNKLARIDTFRSPLLRERSYANDEYDRIGRKGQHFNHGIVSMPVS